MGELQDIIKEIHRHKGVFVESEEEFTLFSEELFYGAAELLGVKREKVFHAAQEFTLNKYKQILSCTKQLYEQNPEKREFYFRPKWDKLLELQRKLANQYNE